MEKAAVTQLRYLCQTLVRNVTAYIEKAASKGVQFSVDGTGVINDTTHEAVSVTVDAPCPFCGGVGEMYRERRFPTLPDDYDGAWAYWVACRSCAAQGGWGKSMGTALDRWNWRWKSSVEMPQELRGEP